MSGATFFDTNVIAYLLSSDARKAEIAERRLAQGGTISVQVLNELANVARRKAGLGWGETAELLAGVRRLVAVAPLTVETHELGMALAERHGFSVYDAMIVAAGLLAGCETLLSEDMQDGMLVAGRMRVVNPFAG
ncbi:PIN domain-containing protein [Amaricoccus sp.]|uniref:PIN domain-containing protein n=1 Tax=Amaricoccus sp. TaxID=1872485 RepID=UPI001B447DD8|nr:PIN domain-containing protein [Amaricoccus sp.]MBP7241331.1 PIN domain-containing protein [Amaricoccus sp.]